MVKIGLAVAVVMLAGCASDSAQVIPDRYFTTYHGMLQNMVWRGVEASPYKTVPGPVRLAYSECAATYVMSAFTEAETARLDSYARHETTMTAGDVNDINTKVRERLGSELSFDNVGQLDGVCPAQAPAFHQYFKPL